MSRAYPPHFTFDPKIAGHKLLGRDVADYIPLQAGRDQLANLPAFNVEQWLSVFYEQPVPPLPMINFDEQLDTLPDQKLQETMAEYQSATVTVKKKRLDPNIESGVSGYPLVEKTKWDIVRSYPADEQYNGHQNLKWVSGNSYFRAVAWCIYGNWELWPHVKAQHRTYFNRALEQAEHPRHTLYKELNKMRKGRNHLNLKERLGTPYCAIRHEDVQQVTADLYGVFLVVFTYQPAGQGIRRSGKPVTPGEDHFAPTLRGDFNRPHKFLRLSIGTLPDKFKHYPGAATFPIWQIYEPMALDEPSCGRHSDFKYALPCWENTKLSAPPGAKEEDWGGYTHPWRIIFGNMPRVPLPLTHSALWPTPAGFSNPRAGDLQIALACAHAPDPTNPKFWNQKKNRWIRGEEGEAP